MFIVFQYSISLHSWMQSCSLPLHLTQPFSSAFWATRLCVPVGQTPSNKAPMTSNNDLTFITTFKSIPTCTCTKRLVLVHPLCRRRRPLPSKRSRRPHCSAQGLRYDCFSVCFVVWRGWHALTTCVARGVTFARRSTRCRALCTQTSRS